VSHFSAEASDARAGCWADQQQASVAYPIEENRILRTHLRGRLRLTDDVFVIDLASRRVQIVGSTPHPNGLFMLQVARTLTAADDGVLVHHRVLICDRDAKWSAPVRALGDAGIRVVHGTLRADERRLTHMPHRV
jgi:hypothetical protein